MKSSNALQSLAIFAVLTAVFALGPIVADENVARANQPGGSGTVHLLMTPAPPPAPTTTQLQTQINDLAKTVKELQIAYNSHCHKMSGLNYITYTTGVNTLPGPGGGNQYYFVVTPQSGAGSYGWQKTDGPSSC
jgi:hypothetical protein